jgi:formylmethanofuran dehydrogenase subunit E
MRWQTRLVLLAKEAGVSDEDMRTISLVDFSERLTAAREKAPKCSFCQVPLTHTEVRLSERTQASEGKLLCTECWHKGSGWGEAQ